MDCFIKQWLDAFFTVYKIDQIFIKITVCIKVTLMNVMFSACYFIYLVVFIASFLLF